MESEQVAPKQEKGLENTKIAHRLLQSIILPGDIDNLATKGLGFQIRDSFESLLYIALLYPFPYSVLTLVFFS